MVAEPLVRVPVPTTPLPLLAASKVTVSPLGGEGLTVTVNVTVWAVADGFGPLSVSVVVVAVMLVALPNSATNAESLPMLARLVVWKAPGVEGKLLASV